MKNYLKFYVLGLPTLILFSAFKLWAPSYNFTIRDNELDYYEKDAYTTTLKNISRAYQTLDICVEDAYPGHRYLKLKPSKNQELIAKKLERKLGTSKHKAFLGKNLTNPSAPEKPHKLTIKENFTTNSTILSLEDAIKYLLAYTESDHCLAKLEKDEKGNLNLLLTRVNSLETWRLELPVEITE